MSTALATQNGITPGELMERVIAAGDISRMEAGDRARYVVKVCESAGLNPLTKPFDLITLNGKLTLYATKGATDQLRKIHGITLKVVGEKQIQDVWQVTVEATAPDGRTDTDIGVVTLGNLKGDALANALMKALTKAKRRVTLSICGLGLLDESEFDTIPRQAFTSQDPEPPQRASNAPTRQESRPEAPPVTAEVVDVARPSANDPREKAADRKKELGEVILELRTRLNWDASRVRAEAEKQQLSLGSVAGLEGMVAVLSKYVLVLEEQDEQAEDEEDYEALEAAAEQPTLLDADVRPVDRWAD